MVDNKKIEHTNDDDVNGNTLFELYKAKANDFQKAFIALLAFALIFLFLILFPYFSILEKNNNINGKIEDLQRNITRHENNIYYYHIAENRIKALQKDLNSPQVVKNETLRLLLITLPYHSNSLFNNVYHNLY